MNDILPKPFTKEGLLDMLEKHLIHLKVIQKQMRGTSISIPRSPGPSGSGSPDFETAYTPGVVAAAAASGSGSSSTTTTTTTNDSSTSRPPNPNPNPNTSTSGSSPFDLPFTITPPPYGFYADSDG
ncbi:hypothetical protein H0H93_001390, partial [Arthromyces matolae]